MRRMDKVLRTRRRCTVYGFKPRLPSKNLSLTWGYSAKNNNTWWVSVSSPQVSPHQSFTAGSLPDQFSC